DRQVGSAADPHGPRRRLFAPAAARGRRVAMRPWRHWTVRARMVLVVAALVAADAAGMTALNNYLISRIDRQLTFNRSNQVPREQRTPGFRPGPDFRV